MTSIEQLKQQVVNANTLGRTNLAEKGVEVPETATTYEIMQGIKDVSGGSKSYADAIYEYYNIDKVAYPCLAVFVQNTKNTRVIRSTTPLVLNEGRPCEHYSVSKIRGLEGETDSGVVFGWLKGYISSMPSWTSENWFLSNGTYFANYPIEETDTVKYYPL